MGSCFKGRKRKDGRPAKYRIAWYDEHGARHVTTAYTDKSASMAELAKKEKEVERRKAGLVTPSDEKRKEPIANIIRAYLADMTTRGKSESYRREQERLLTTTTEECRWPNLGAIRADGLEPILTRLRGERKSARTLNSYRDAVMIWLNWCLARPRVWIAENPLEGISKAREEGGRKRRPRRAYTKNEMTALLTSLEERRGPTGLRIPNRKLWYLTASLSGLRRREMSLIQKRDCEPIGQRPVWRLRPETTKGRRAETVPMLPECASAIQHHWSSLEGATDLVFPPHSTHPNTR